jgi:hypothetical protein
LKRLCGSDFPSGVDVFDSRELIAVEQILARCAAVSAIDPDTDVPAAAHAITGAMRGIHATVFDGGDPSQALRFIDRLHLTVSTG